LLTIILLDVAGLLYRPIHVLRRRGAIACVPLGRCHLSCGRRHPHLDWPRLLLRFCPTTLRNRWWLTAILADERLLPVNRRRGRRWRGLRNHSTSCNSLWRTRLRRPAASRERFPFGGYRRCSGGDLRAGDLSLINPHDVPSHRLRSGHDLSRCSRHCAWHSLIHISDVIDVRLVYHHRVVVVVDYRRVHGGVGHIHVVHVAATSAV